MGLFSGRWKSTFGSDSRNPNPRNYEVLRERNIGHLFVSEVKYPNCTNYEGHKILVTERSVRGRSELDPHFTADSDIIARFVPNDEGWSMAVDFAKMVGD